jgi:ribosomal protein S16
VDYWTSKGAQVSDRVKKLLDKAPSGAAATVASSEPAASAA